MNNIDLDVRLECLRLASTLPEVKNHAEMVAAAEALLAFCRGDNEPGFQSSAVSGNA